MNYKRWCENSEPLVLLKDRIKAAGYNQASLAKAMNARWIYIWKVVTKGNILNKSGLSYNKWFLKICDFLGCKPIEVLPSWFVIAEERDAYAQLEQDLDLHREEHKHAGSDMYRIRRVIDRVLRSTLPDKLVEIVKYRVGLYDGEEWPYELIARQYPVSYVYRGKTIHKFLTGSVIQQQYVKAIRQLRRSRGFCELQKIFQELIEIQRSRSNALRISRPAEWATCKYHGCNDEELYTNGQ